MTITRFEYPGCFLEQFEKLQRGTVANWYCYAFRDGANTLDDLIRAVRERGETVIRRSVDFPTFDKSQAFLADQLLDVLETDESYSFAEFIIARESLPEAERQRLKAERAETQRAAYMESQSPSLKQLTYLKGLGHSEDQMPTSKAAASKLIDHYLQQSKAKRQAGVSASGCKE